MAERIRVYRVNTGSCGGCDLLIEMALRADPGLDWAESPEGADVLLLTGTLTAMARPAFLELWRAHGARVPLVAVGGCAIDGQPFGRGGLAGAPEVVVRAQVAGCPPPAGAIGAAIRDARGSAGGAL